MKKNVGLQVDAATEHMAKLMRQMQDAEANQWRSGTTPEVERMDEARRQLEELEASTRRPGIAPESQSVPYTIEYRKLRIEPAPKDMGWSLKKIKRAPGYRWPLYLVLKAAYDAGKPCPKAREVLEEWKKNAPPDLQVMPDGVKWSNAVGSTKEADLKAIQQAIKGLCAG